MSLSEWEKIYYPVPADQIKTQAEALDHSILKWSGLRPKVLRAHGIVRYGNALYDEEEGSRFEVAGQTCALCDLDSREVATNDCTTCALYKSRGNVACAIPCVYEETSPYEDFGRDGNPEPMLFELHKAKAWLEGGEAEDCGRKE